MKQIALAVAVLIATLSVADARGYVGPAPTSVHKVNKKTHP
jgi:hypothetical protein